MQRFVALRNRRIILGIPLTRLMFFCLLYGVLGFAQENKGLSEADIIHLHAAGVSDDAIIHQIQQDGVSFHAEASTTIRLKSAGISEPVITAILTGGAQSAAAVSDMAVRVMYAHQNYDQLRQYVGRLIKDHPTSEDTSKSRALLVLVALKQDDLEFAKEQMALLEKDQTAAGQSYGKKARDTLAKYEEARTQKQQLILALNSLNARKAREVIGSMSLSDAQKLVLLTQVAIYEGKYDEARQILSRADETVSSKLKGKIDEAQATYSRLSSAIDRQMYSPLVPSECVNAEGTLQKYYSDFSTLSLESFLQTVQQLFDLAPLNDHVLDLVFFSAVMTASSGEVLSIGDKVLAAKGQIRIPFYASDRFFSVVIDNQKRHLYSVDDQHPFSVRYVWHPGFKIGGGSLKPGNVNPHLPALQPFDLAYTDINGLEQHIVHGLADGEFVSQGSYALKLSPQGLAPAFTFMHYLGCIAGGRPPRSAARNIGTYIVHVTGMNQKSVRLADPNAGGESGLSASMVGPATGYFGAIHSLAAQQMVLQAQASTTAENLGIEGEQSKQWADILNIQKDAIDQNIFQGLERMLQL